MNHGRFAIPLALACCLLIGMPALAGNPEKANQAFAAGNAQLREGGFSTALKSYGAAAKADPDNQAYRDQYSLVRRVIKMRKRIGREKNPQKWETTSLALRAFYYANGLHTEALALDREAHKRLNTADTAGRLAETQLELGMDAETAALLSGMDEAHTSLQTQVLLGIAQARSGQTAEAQAVAKRCAPTQDTKPGTLHDLARLKALTGAHEEALKLLTSSFENTPPSRLDAFKQYTKDCKDLSGLIARADFAAVLETASKVKESDCSGGTSCGKCPSRSGCSKPKPATSGAKTETTG